MSIIKLNATSSTNDYLKELSKKEWLENYTVVLAREQTMGRGQMGTTWVSEKDKNLIMSILIKDIVKDIRDIFHLNRAISMSIIAVLKDLHIPDVSIKWPNDIMAGNKKTAGILIENTIKSDNTVDTIVGIGLNVNQTSFTNLPKATSLFCITGKEFNVETICLKIQASIQLHTQKLTTQHTYKDEYHKYLYRRNIPSVFQINATPFMGIILGVNDDGMLEVKDEFDNVTNYALKQITLLS